MTLLMQQRDFIIAAAFASTTPSTEIDEETAAWRAYVMDTSTSPRELYPPEKTTSIETASEELNMPAVEKQWKDTTDRPLPSTDRHLPKDVNYAIVEDRRNVAGILDPMMMEWMEDHCDDDDDDSMVIGDLSRVHKNPHAILVQQFGLYFTRCLLSPHWKVRRQTIRTAELYSYLLSQGSLELERLFSAFFLLLQFALEDPILQGTTSFLFLFF